MRRKLLKTVCVIIYVINENSLWVDSDVTFLDKIVTAVGSLVNGPKKPTESLRKEGNDSTLEMTTPQFIRHEGYPAQTHTVLTSDKYFIEMHRIPGRPGSPAVFLQHGILASSFDWVVAGKGKSLAFILSDLGYDVWIGNSRGNTYCKKHEVYSKDDDRFWAFSWHEMGVYDLPAEINYITRIKKSKIIYIGHSMGSTMFYVMAIEKPEIAANVKAMFSFSPIAFVNDIKSPIKLLAPFSYQFETLQNVFGHGEFLPDDAILKTAAEAECQSQQGKEAVCANMLFLLFGYDEPQFNYTLLPRFSSHTPAGTSARVIAHYAQEVKSGKFQHYIHGPESDEKKLIEYDIKKINVPVGLFWSENDWLADPKDVKELWNLLPRKLMNHKVQYKDFNHMDFLLGMDAPTLVYKPLITEMKKLE